MDIKQSYEVLYDKYGTQIYRTILAYLKNTHDAEDVLQNTFYKLYISDKDFESEEYVKNWLFFVAINEAKNVLKSRWRFYQSLDEVVLTTENEEHHELFEQIMKLPDKYRLVIVLHYYNGYTAAEIARFLDKKESTILTQLQRGREKLEKLLIGGGQIELFE